ncbi:MAG: PAS domain S-box protein [Candidatus Zixiibacteriota bacterium]|nr:MAG: PAS domain S-box protein [candidate division Zixibacteria bacterium]
MNDSEHHKDDPERNLDLIASCVEQTSEGISVSDLDGNILYVNQAYAAMHGYKPEELVGEHLSIFHTAEQMPDVETAIRQLKETGQFIGELEHVRRDGTVFPTFMHNSLRRDTDGNSVGMIATVRDISDLKETERALRHSEARLRTIFQTTPDAVSISRLADGLYVEVNDGFMASTGYQRSEVVGRSSLDLGIWDNPEDRVALAQGLRERGRMVNLEANFRAKNGTIIVGLLSAQLIDLEGEPHIIAVVRDITERKASEEALRESGQKFRDLGESTRAAIFIFQGSKNVYANPAALTITGYSLEEIQTMDFWELIHPEFRDLARERGMARQQDHRITPRYELKILTKSGETRWVDYAGTRISYLGNPAVLGTAFDITDRKEAEQLLRETTEELRTEQQALADKNVALKQVLEHIEEERRGYKKRICDDVRQTVTPFIERLRRIVRDERVEPEIEALMDKLNAELERNIDAFSELYASLTPRELQICELIKEGRSSKQISSDLSLSLLTVHKHREQIREKLGITNKQVNLSVYLRNRQAT